jgi:hypothetical protein
MPQKTLRKPEGYSYSPLKHDGRVYGYEGCFVSTVGLGMMWALTMAAWASVYASLGVTTAAAVGATFATAKAFYAWYSLCAKG